MYYKTSDGTEPGLGKESGGVLLYLKKQSET
jgi:hypothetical protein